MRILKLDIETAPHSAFIWSLWTKYVSPDHVEVPGYTLCFAAQWEGEKKTHFFSVWDDGLEGMIEAAHKLLEEADAVIHYNGTKFDIPMLNNEMLLLDMAPPAPCHQIDLFQVVRKHFRFPSMKLDYVCKRLDIGAKRTHKGMELWLEVMQGVEKSCNEMRRYNIQDVKLLGPLYKRLLPWITSHPNYALYTDHDRPVCPNCGSEHLTRQGMRTTKTQAYARFQCQDCGTWTQERFTCLPKDKRKSILKQVAL